MRSFEVKTVCSGSAEEALCEIPDDLINISEFQISFSPRHMDIWCTEIGDLHEVV